MAERGLLVDHTSIWRWTQTYGPEVYRRLTRCGEPEILNLASIWSAHPALLQ